MWRGGKGKPGGRAKSTSRQVTHHTKADVVAEEHGADEQGYVRPLLPRIILRSCATCIACMLLIFLAKVTSSFHAHVPMLLVPEPALAQPLRCIHIH